LLIEFRSSINCFPEQEKRSAILQTSLQALESGALNNMLWGIIETTIREVMKLPAATGLTRDQVINLLTTDNGSGYYNKDFHDSYRHFNTLKALIEGES